MMVKTLSVLMVLEALVVRAVSGRQAMLVLLGLKVSVVVGPVVTLGTALGSLG